MTFNEALKKLNIEDFEDRIYHSNSHRELFHIYDYFQLATLSDDMTWFRPVFLQIVEQAEKHWNRPESVFQHILEILQDNFNKNK